MTLREWHDKLFAHFSNLHEQRLDACFSVFAIEHDLSVQELIELKQAIRTHVNDYEPSGADWLPWVVYAAEIGYEFDGREYWDSFAAKTPGWIVNGKRPFIRDGFRRFVKSFGGFEPTGAWAEHRRIICYPITHSIIPKDLLRQLAKILYDLRFQLNRSFLQSSENLGISIAERSDDASNRFQLLAQNTELTGLIARELLSHGEEAGPSVILASALKRIVEDLKLERDAGSWLDQARIAAKENSRRGGSRERVERQYSPRADIKPNLMLRPVNETDWNLYLKIPDLLPLTRQSDELREFLETSHPKINGSFDDKRLSSGQLVSYGPQLKKLKALPDGDKPLLIFRREEPASLTKFLKEEFILTTKNTILFRKHADGSAYKQETSVVRPGGSYLILCDQLLTNNSLITKQNISCENLRLYLLRVPKAISTEDDAFLDSLGLITDFGININPVGNVPAAWDGANRVEWLADENPCFALELNREVETLKLECGENRLEIQNPPIDEPLFVNLPYLPIGTYKFSAFGKTQSHSEHQLFGDAEISIREPRSFRRDSATSQNALLLFTDPFRPSFEQLFSDRVSFDFMTPPDTSVNIYLKLLPKDSKDGQLLKKLLVTVSLPNDSDEMDASIRRALKTDAKIVEKAGSAHSCALEFEAGELGTVSVNFEREFLPLRWEAKSDNKGQTFLRLSDESDDGEPVSIVKYDFAAPNKSEKILYFEADESGYLVPTTGGLFVALNSHSRPGIVVLRRAEQSSYKSFAEIGRAQDLVPRFVQFARDADRLSELIDLYSLWTNSASVGNVFKKADLTVISDGFLLEIVSLADDASGWRKAETQYTADRFAGFNNLRRAVSPKISMTDALVRCCNEFIGSPEDWTDRLVSVLGGEVPSEMVRTQKPGRVLYMRPVKPVWFAEFALRLCSRPDTLRKWAAERYELGLKKMLERPTLVRAARFVVLTARGEKLNDKHQPYKWNWE